MIFPIFSKTVLRYKFQKHNQFSFDTILINGAEGVIDWIFE